MEKPIEYINLWELQTYPENLVLAKIDIEEYNQAEEKQTINDFIRSLKFDCIYTYKEYVIPFSMSIGNKARYIMYSIFDDDRLKEIKEEAFSHFKKKMESIGYDLTKLEKKSNFELISMDMNILQEGEYFILKNDFYL